MHAACVSQRTPFESTPLQPVQLQRTSRLHAPAATVLRPNLLQRLPMCIRAKLTGKRASTATAASHRRLAKPTMRVATAQNGSHVRALHPHHPVMTMETASWLLHSSWHKTSDGRGVAAPGVKRMPHAKAPCAQKGFAGGGGKAGSEGKARARQGVPHRRWRVQTGTQGKQVQEEWEGVHHPENTPTWRPRKNRRVATRAVCQRPSTAALFRHADAKSWQLLEMALYGSRANWLAPLSSAASQAAAVGLLLAPTCQYLVSHIKRSVLAKCTRRC